MTFIASVVAKNGVAIIADSLVTTSKPVIELSDFKEYIDSKQTPEGEKINIDFNEILNLFRTKPSHTRDYEEKLFKYDTYTAVTTAGYAVINGKKIEKLIGELVARNQQDTQAYQGKSLEEKVKDFCRFFTDQAKENINTWGRIGETNFIFTHYSKEERKSIIYKIELCVASKANLSDESFEFVKYYLQDEQSRVVFDGQNRISERILFGDRATIPGIVSKVINQVTADHNITVDNPTAYFQSVVEKSGILGEDFFDDMKVYQLTPLSIQQAVDLACLLMRIEMDFQKYTKNIPTVGGVIKLAIVDDMGFRFISGHRISKPDVIRAY
jgi:hypothetical protein